METPTPPVEEPELKLLLSRDSGGDWARWRAAAIGSLLAHVIFTTTIFSVRFEVTPPPPERVLVKQITPLYIPPDLTQKAPNKVPVAKELTVESIAPRPVLKSPAPAPAAGKPVEAIKQPTPPAPAPVAPPRQVPFDKPVVMEAPKLDGPVQPVQTSQNPKQVALPPPPSAEAPKLALQDVGVRPSGTGGGRPGGMIQMPTASIQDTLREMSHSSGTPGTQSVGDLGADVGGAGAGLNLPPTAGRPHSNWELKSDPMGVDFRPYMLQVLAAVRRSWFAVYPEAARMGMRGQVVVQFAIAKQGMVTKVAFNGQSGAKALDQSAVAAISASNPLPPLPPEFKGDRIVLQMTFLYNMPR